MAQQTAAEKRLRRQLSDLRRKLGRSVKPFRDSSPEAIANRWERSAEPDYFGRTYLPHYAESDPAPFHDDLAEMLAWPERHVFAVHGPREHAKSSVARIVLLSELVRGETQYVLFGSETLKLARGHVRAFKMELERNARLKADFRPVVDQWSEQDGVLEVTVTPRATGVSSTFRIEAVSWGTQVKGKLWMALRPQKALVDDFENTRTSKNQAVSRAKLDWILQELYPAVTGAVLWVGNVGHDSSALYAAGLRVFGDDDDALRSALRAGTPWGVSIPDRAPSRRSRTPSEGSDGEIGPEEDFEVDAELSFYSYRAEYELNERTRRTWADLYGEAGAAGAVERVFGSAGAPDGTAVYLWADRYEPRWYAAMRATMGALFEGEMNGYPVRAGLFFKSEWFPRWRELPDGATWFSWMDPAFGQSKHSCYKVVVVGCILGATYYVVACYCRQGEALSKALDWWHAAFDRFDGLLSGAYENNFDQENRLRPDLAAVAERHGSPLPVRGEPNKLDKFVRIDGMQVRAEANQIQFPASMDADMRVLWNQLMEYPDAAYVDGPDALESLVSRLRTSANSAPSYTPVGPARRFVRTRARAA